MLRCTDELTDLFRDERSASIATKITSISSEAVPSEAPAVEASVSITIGHVGELEAIVETVAVVVGEMAVGVAVGEPMSLRNTHNAQPPELLYRRRITDHTWQRVRVRLGEIFTSSFISTCISVAHSLRLNSLY